MLKLLFLLLSFLGRSMFETIVIISLAWELGDLDLLQDERDFCVNVLQSAMEEAGVRMKLS